MIEHDERFWDQVKKDHGGCLVWTGKQVKRGAPPFDYHGVYSYLHQGQSISISVNRYAWFQLTEARELPELKQNENMHNLCGDNFCVEPTHWERRLATVENPPYRAPDSLVPPKAEQEPEPVEADTTDADAARENELDLMARARRTFRKRRAVRACYA